MTSRKTVVAYSPDGQEMTWQTTGNYDVAGIVKDASGAWSPAQYGNSWDSVRRRTRALVNRRQYTVPCSGMAVVSVHEATAPILRDYFGTHDVRITALFKNGWKDVTGTNGRKAFHHGGRSMLRTLGKDGVEAIMVTANGRSADFMMTEIEKSLRTRSR